MRVPRTPRRAAMSAATGTELMTGYAAKARPDHVGVVLNHLKHPPQRMEMLPLGSLEGGAISPTRETGTGRAPAGISPRGSIPIGGAQGTRHKSPTADARA
jgi:hypothetical protein